MCIYVLIPPPPLQSCLPVWAQPVQAPPSSASSRLRPGCCAQTLPLAPGMGIHSVLCEPVQNQCVNVLSFSCRKRTGKSCMFDQRYFSEIWKQNPGTDVSILALAQTFSYNKHSLGFVDRLSHLINSLSSKGICHPFAGHGCGHERNDVLQTTSQFKHDDNQWHGHTSHTTWRETWEKLIIIWRLNSIYTNVRALLQMYDSERKGTKDKNRSLTNYMPVKTVGLVSLNPI